MDSWVGLGVRSVRWHPTGDWLAVGGWDGKVRVLESFLELWGVGLMERRPDPDLDATGLGPRRGTFAPSSCPFFGRELLPHSSGPRDRLIRTDGLARTSRVDREDTREGHRGMCVFFLVWST